MLLLMCMFVKLCVFVQLVYTHICYCCMDFQVAQRVKNPPAMPETQEIWAWSLGWEDPLEEEVATHSSILAWRIPWAEETGGLQSTKSWVWLSNWAPNAVYELLAALRLHLLCLSPRKNFVHALRGVCDYLCWSVGLSKFSYHYEKVLKNSA